MNDSHCEQEPWREEHGYLKSSSYPEGDFLTFLSFQPSIYLSIYLSMYPSIYLSIYLNYMSFYSFVNKLRITMKYSISFFF